MANDQNQRAGPENSEDTDATKKNFNAGGNSSDYDGGHPKDAVPGSEGRVDAEKSTQNENKTQKQFNAGGNDSDYDGGHPKDAQQDSEGRVDKEE